MHHMILLMSPLLSYTSPIDFFNNVVTQPWFEFGKQEFRHWSLKLAHLSIEDKLIDRD